MNVNVSDITIQAPIGVVANVCDVNVAVLANLVADDRLRAPVAPPHQHVTLPFDG